MESDQAAEHLQTIRTLMERSAVYRRALAPIMIYCGVVGLVGGAAGGFLTVNTVRGFVIYWAAIAIVAVTGSFLHVRRQALKDSEPFWSPPTRRVYQALIPPFVVGAFCGALAASTELGTCFPMALVPFWCVLFGFAIYSAGFFMPRGLRLFGWLFIIIGCLLALCLSFTVELAHFGLLTPLINFPNWLMGGIFGGLHLAYGIYLYFTEKRGNAS